MDGVLGFVEAVITISRKRGIPSVTLAAPWPVHPLVNTHEGRLTKRLTGEMERV